MKLSLLTTILAVAACVQSRSLQQAAKDLDAPVREGIAVLQVRAEVSLQTAKDLIQVLKTGDLDDAKAAYTLSRPEYEQIEVLAGSFEDIDSDLDARAYSFDNGEAVEGAEDLFERGAHFQGYHRIEALLFRNGNMNASVPYAEALVEDIEDLIVALKESDRFNAPSTFAGIIGLSTEVAAKKMSSEEETFSDLTVLIIYNNYLGVESQYRPFAAMLKEIDSDLADSVDDALKAWLSTIEPHFTINDDESITYKKYTAVSTSERAAIQAAAYTVADMLRKAAEALEIDLGGGEEEEEECEGEPITFFDGESDEIKAGLDYFRALIPFAKKLVDDLVTAIESGDVDEAKEAYKRSRPPYEQIEVLAVSFGDEDSDIDARPYAFEFGEFDEGFKGFHKLERKIYRDEDLGEDTVAVAMKLKESLKALEERLNDSSLFNSVTNFEGMIGLATEVPARKISSEEEMFSGLSILIYYMNWKGIYSQLKPFLTESNKGYFDLAFDGAFKCLGVETDDVWDAVSASDVDESFVMNLSNAKYPIYDLEDLGLRECVTINSYNIRDLISTFAHDLGVFVDCHPFHPNAYFSYRHEVITE